MDLIKIVRNAPRHFQTITSSREIHIDMEGYGGLSHKYILVLGDNEIPQWLLTVESYVVAPSHEDRRSVKVILERAVSLWEAWPEIIKMLNTQDLRMRNEFHVDVDALIKLGVDVCGGDDVPAQEPLTAVAAAERLAWTYGVKPENVKISICL